MFTSFQAKTYQQLAELFSPRSAVAAKVEEEMNTKTHGQAGEEGAVGKYSMAPIVKNSLEIECQGKKYAYHLGEVLKRKWEIPDTKPAKKVSGGGGHGGVWMKLLGGGGASMDAQPAKRDFTVRFCLFGVNTEAITPFLEFWLVPNAENVLAFPETEFEAMGLGLGGEDSEEEEHAAFLDVCRKKFVELGIAGDQEAYTTERMERDYHGYLFGPGEDDRVVYVFFQVLPGEGAVGKLAILDEMLNRHKVLETPVDAKMRALFYNYPELLYLYGSPVSPIDSVVFGEDSEYDATEEAPQEIPYCLYLCQDKAKLSEEAQEGKAVETPSGNVLPGLEEPHYVSPKDKYQLTPGKTDLEHLRTEDEYGYFYYFTHELMGNEDAKMVKRYAVFTYNMDYRLDAETLALLKSSGLDKLMKGGSHMKRELDSHDWVFGGGKGGAERVDIYYAPSAEIQKGDEVIVKKEFVEEIYVKRPNTPVPEEEESVEDLEMEMEEEPPGNRKALDINPEPEEEDFAEGAVEDLEETEDTREEEEPVEEAVEDLEKTEEEPVEEAVEEDLEETEEEPVEEAEEEEDKKSETETETASESEEGAVEDDANTEYASVYFQRDGVPLWCIKHRICFTCLDSDASSSPPPTPDSETVVVEESIKIEKEK